MSLSPSTPVMHALNVELVDVSTLVPDPANARLHDAKNLQAIADSLRTFGQDQPLVVQRQGRIVRKGNGRLAAMIAAGWKQAAVVFVDEADVVAVARAIADNRSAELARWDDPVLHKLLTSIPSDMVPIVGFDAGDMGDLIKRIGASEPGTGAAVKPDSMLGLVDEETIRRCAAASRIVQGNNLDTARTLASQSVQTIVTSPPYYGLRDYGTARWDGGDAACDHVERTAEQCHSKSTLGANGKGHPATNAAYKALERQFRDVCGKCGAKRVDEQIGLEETPDAYIENLVTLFRELRRVLKDDGVLWINIGDTYAAGCMTGKSGPNSSLRVSASNKPNAQHDTSLPARKPPPGLKPKDLIGIPWMLAFALRADGWYLRQDAIWAKPNPMPESVTDRCTKAHEYVFMLSKSQTYYFDARANQEMSAESRSGNAARVTATERDCPRDGVASGVPWAGTTRNRRSVWNVASRAFPGAHFAPYPPELITPCVLTCSRPGDVILDPFFGAGTTGVVALRHGRAYLGLELNPKYIEIAQARLADPRIVLDDQGGDEVDDTTQAARKPDDAV